MTCSFNIDHYYYIFKGLIRLLYYLEIFLPNITLNNGLDEIAKVGGTLYEIGQEKMWY